jgi:allantoin racemase
MRILYLIPGWMSKTEGGRHEMARRGQFLRQSAQTESVVDVWDVEGGPSSIESMYEEYLSVPGALGRIQEAAAAGYAGVILGCFGDPGVDAARELVTIPVVGPGEAGMLFAASLGHRFSIVTILDSVIHPLRRLARDVGVDSKLASVRAVNIPVLELARDRTGTFERMLEAGRLARDVDGADTLVLGCMTMAFLGEHRALGEALGIPVVNPVHAALRLVESLVAMGLAHSKRAFPTPPKMVAPEAARAW